MKVKIIKEEFISFGFDIGKNLINCTQNAVDLPNNQFGINVFIDVLKDDNGIVLQRDKEIGACSLISPSIRKLYKTCKFTVQLNISLIDWTDKDESLFFKLGANTVYQLPMEKEVGIIINSDLKLLTELDIEEDKRGFTFAKKLVTGKSLSNRDELFSRVKMLVNSKF